MKKIYLDYAATTPVLPEVVRAMAPFWSEKFGNASSLHSFGQEARQVVEDCRGKVAQVLNCLPEEIFFTGTTTQSDNLAILGIAHKAEEKVDNPARIHLITSAIEHHAVLDTFKHLDKRGFRVTYLPVNKDGLVEPEVLEKSLSQETRLVSIMYANNEVGTIQPLKEIAGKIKAATGKFSRTIYFHTDAAAVAEYLSLDVQKLGVDCLTLGGHKFGGPKGVGILFVKKGTQLKSITFGGHHEQGLWPGTEAVPLIVGITTALQMASRQRLILSKRVTKLRDKLIKEVIKNIPQVILTGHREKRLPDLASFCFKGAEGEAILLRLDAAGIAVSSGSACTSGSLEPSHVLLALGLPPEVAHGSIRFSLGSETTETEIDEVLRVLPKIIADIRTMAPKL